MASREDVLKKINPTSTYIGSAVKGFINEVTCEAKTAPDFFKKGDIIKVGSSQSDKKRPSVIVKVAKDYVVSIDLTTTENLRVLCESKSRFLKDSFFCNSYTITPIDLAKESFIGVYDNMKVLNQAIKELKVFISKNL